MSFSYYMEQKTFNEASFINDINTWKGLFAAPTFKGLWNVSFQDRVKKACSIVANFSKFESGKLLV